MVKCISNCCRDSSRCNNNYTRAHEMLYSCGTICLYVHYIICIGKGFLDPPVYTTYTENSRKQKRFSRTVCHNEVILLHRTTTAVEKY